MGVTVVNLAPDLDCCELWVKIRRQSCCNIDGLHPRFTARLRIFRLLFCRLQQVLYLVDHDFDGIATKFAGFFSKITSPLSQ